MVLSLDLSQGNSFVADHTFFGLIEWIQLA
jgi:hypothetical protein